MISRAGKISVYRGGNRAMLGRNSANFGEITVTTETILEAGGTRDTIGDESFTAVVPFLDQGLANAEAVAANGRTAVGTDADLRKSRYLIGQGLGLGARRALWRDILA